MERSCKKKIKNEKEIERDSIKGIKFGFKTNLVNIIESKRVRNGFWQMENKLLKVFGNVPD